MNLTIGSHIRLEDQCAAYEDNIKMDVSRDSSVSIVTRLRAVRLGFDSW
jgi:hypothetical protein